MYSTCPSLRTPWVAISPPATALQQAAGVPDTDLAKHYLTHTAETFVASSIRDTQSEFWRVVVPALSYTSTPVRHGMLALAALCSHYDTTSPTEPSSIFLRAAETHGLQAIGGLRQQLQDLHESEIDSTMTCSRIICVLGFAFFRTHRRNGITIAESKAWTWLQLLRGVGTVLNSILASGQAFDTMISRDMKPELLIANTACDTRPRDMRESSNHPLLSLVQTSCQESFANLRTRLFAECTSSLNKEQATDLFHAIEALQEITKQVCSGEMHSLTHAICTWPCKISQGVVDMLVNGNHLALAVHAHWLMLTVLAEDLWWIDDMGRAGIREIIGHFSQASNENSSKASILLRWPRHMLNTDAGGFAPI